MKVLIAPDSFKGAASSVEVSAALAEGLKAWSPGIDCQLHPLADGGEGSTDALLAAIGGDRRTNTVRDPLGRKVDAMWALLADGHTAVIEMASASGLPLLGESERNPLVASSYGTGELIRAALDAGATTILLCIGGSATNDAAAGVAQALGYRLLDQKGEELPPGGAALARLARVDSSHIDPRVAITRIEVACDVTNPLLGPEGASAVYGPQKGADPAMVRQLDQALAHVVTVAGHDLPPLAPTTAAELAKQAGAGAAGGLGFGLQLFLGATLSRGIDLIMRLSHFEQRVAECDLVLSGEGRSDKQSLYGKVLQGVAQTAQKHQKPLVVFSGSLAEGVEPLLSHGVSALFSIIDQPMSLSDAMRDTCKLLFSSALRSAPLLSLISK